MEEFSNKISINNALETALEILLGFDSQSGLLEALEQKAFARHPGLTRKDRAFVTALAHGVIRWRARVDWIIAFFSKAPDSRISPRVKNILRLGVFQLLFMSRVPPAVSVNACVGLAKKRSPAWIPPFVNGVLRNVARQGSQIAIPDPAADPVQAVSVGESFPEWLVARWLSRLGLEQTIALCQALNRVTPITVRTNTLLTTPAGLKTPLFPEVENLWPTLHAPVGFHFQRPRQAISCLDAFKKGWFAVQDEGAQLIGHLLSPRPGERVLDACSGLGVKSGHLAQLMENQGQILALDSDSSKLQTAAQEMQRLGATIVVARQWDLNRPYPDSGNGFDKILVDAPCSSLGVIRKHPDAKWIKSPDTILQCARIQSRILDSASVSLKIDGCLVYAVCSLEPEETMEVVLNFLSRHPDFALDEKSDTLAQFVSRFVNQEGFFHTEPHTHDMDGFFAVRLTRKR